MKEPVWLLKSSVIAVHNMLIVRFGGLDGIRDEDLVDSALARPASLYHYERCSNVSQLAAAYAGSIIQNHPFVDGNKRTGFMAAFIFLDLNGKTLQADEVTATGMTLSLAASDINEREYAAWLAENIGAK
ncbi:MAG: type II toxin-antitoxin system death-on-curing family toxin [Gammaproteobacteria bacterium]|jgi:death-on-curing protein